MNKKIPYFIISVIICLSALPLFLNTNKLSTDISVLLPEDEWIQAHMDFLRSSQLASITALSLDADSPEAAARLPEFAEEISEKLKETPHITKVFFRIPPDLLTQTAGFLCPRAPQVLNHKDIENINGKLSDKSIKRILHSHYEELMRPGGLFRQKLIASDPLDIYKIVFKKIEMNSRDSGFKFVLRNNGLWSADGKHFLMLIYTDIPPTDANKGGEYLKSLKHCIKSVLGSAKSHYSFILMAGHRHAVENKKLLNHDISITLTVAAIGFFLLFLFFFKDWRAVLVFIIPVFGMLAAVGLTWASFSRPSAIILGLGATVIGIALDYGIHAFISLKSTGSAGIKKIARPVLFSALTTLGVFWAFFFSGTPGYHQLAFASTCGIVISLILSMVCLPLFITPENEPVKNISSGFIFNLSFPSLPDKKAKVIILLWIMLLGVSIYSIRMVHFDSDIRKMDGAEAVLKNDRDKFEQIWGKNSQAAVTVTSADFESAMEIQDKIANYAESERIKGFKSLSLIWPSSKTRKQNFKRWVSFWKENEDSFKNKLASYGKQYGFSAMAFKPFFNSLYTQDFSASFRDVPSFSLIAGKFVSDTQKTCTVTAYFPDTNENISKMKKETAAFKNSHVISPHFFGTYISNQIIHDALFIAIIAIFLVITLAWVCLKKIYYTFAALTPVISSSAVIVPLYVLFGWKINAISLVAMIVVTGLSIDYGIFAVESAGGNDVRFRKNAFTALTISMLSTIIGSAALLWASHPALNSVGKVITAGVITGYLCAVFVVPAMIKLKQNKEPENGE